MFIVFRILFISLQSIAKTTEQGIRGVWVPAPRFTPVLHSYQGVKDFVKTLDELNMNSIFLVSYAETKTIYRSDVLMHYSTYKNTRRKLFTKWIFKAISKSNQ